MGYIVIIIIYIILIIVKYFYVQKYLNFFIIPKIQNIKQAVEIGDMVCYNCNVKAAILALFLLQ